MSNSELSEAARLKTFLAKHRFSFVSEIRASHSEGVDFALFIPMDCVSNLADGAHTSRRQLSHLNNLIKNDLGISVEWILTTGEKVASLEVGLMKILQSRFPGIIDSVFISAANMSPVWIWIEPVANVEELPDIKAVESACTELLKLFGIKAEKVVYTNSIEVPTNSMILRRLKIHSPVSVEEFANKLRENGFTIPSDNWLRTKLDTMRRNKLLIWLKEKKYALNESGLNTVSYNKTRSSSDVERALALGRRKW